MCSSLFLSGGLKRDSGAALFVLVGGEFLMAGRWWGEVPAAVNAEVAVRPTVVAIGIKSSGAGDGCLLECS